MAAKKKPETAKQQKARHVETLARAYWGRSGLPMPDRKPEKHHSANEDYKILRAAVYAIIPGRQRAKHLGPAMDAAVKAAARVIRRG